jgi:predicted HD superfamily hydrolase involved in NAD metabolism
MLNAESIREKLRHLLNKDRFRHSQNVEAAAIELALHWGESKEKAGIAGLLHDCSRWMSPKEMLKKAKALKIGVDPVEELEPKLLHARLSAHFARTDFDVLDRQILSAIEKHTTGSPAMSKLEQIVYLADHTEPERDFTGVEHIRALAFKDLDKAVIFSTSSMIKALVDLELPVFHGTSETRNYYLMKR